MCSREDIGTKLLESSGRIRWADAIALVMFVLERDADANSRTMRNRIQARLGAAIVASPLDIG